LESLRDDLILMRASARRRYFESGGCAAAPFFLLRAQKKEGKEKGTLLTRPAAALRSASLTGARQLAVLKHASLSPVRDCDARRVRREPWVGNSTSVDISNIAITKQRQRLWQPRP
jgi:hypothetical protein